jgi:hypothetical protein
LSCGYGFIPAGVDEVFPVGFFKVFRLAVHSSFLPSLHMIRGSGV